ncbi:hypothetical protein LSM04_002389 [Trypanosoma melophagium]|uniref:uncharacterized protein n=1 Tax=Trypanosoma melophagium TaxID=715481 RepID=UPI00351A3EF0|nr:hypothetical protein LSM04_002389 [Trypanosoma melophagium]
MFFIRSGRSGSVFVKCIWTSRSYYSTSYCLHYRVHRPGNHRQSQAAGRAAATAMQSSAIKSTYWEENNGSSENIQGINGDNNNDNNRNNRNATISFFNSTDSLPISGPTSPQAYLYRLHHGRFDSLTSLLSMPYAAPPLRILTDVLREAMQLKLHLKNEGSENIQCTNGKESNETLEIFKRITKSLSDPLAVRVLLRKAVEMVQEVKEGVTEMGDELSEHEFQEKLYEIECFVEQLRQWKAPVALTNFSSNTISSLGDEDFRLMLEWNLPDVAMADMWRTVLELSSLTGNYTLAVESLDQLINLSELLERVAEKKKKKNKENELEEDEHQLLTFSLDTVVETVEEEARHTLIPVSAVDHIYAIQSCTSTRKFDIAYSLFQRYMQHAQNGIFPLSEQDITKALIALAGSCDNTAHFAQLQELLVESEAAAAVSVSVELYTALIDAVSRAVENPQRMSVALALYRRLRDIGLQPNANTYAALIACCATTREPTHAFAFYHEARQQCGVDNFTPAVYTNLLRAYATAGYGADARQTLEVLVEAGAPLTRRAFHAVLSCAPTVRDAEEVVRLMQTSYRITPTPQTYAYLIKTASVHPQGVSTALRIFDWHELTLKSLLESGNRNKQLSLEATVDDHAEKRTALSTSGMAVTLEEDLLRQYPVYGEAVETALLRLRVDPTMNPDLESYMRPLIRVAQLCMNTFTGMSPQAPTRIPKGSAIAVLAADVLANIEEWFIPFISYYSAVVIPYSSLAVLRRGSGKRIDTTFEKGPQQLLHDSNWRELASEQEVIVESRRRILMQFLKKYRDFIHLVSLQEELALSRDCDRYGIGVKKTFSRCAAFALNLARMDVVNGRKVYAEQDCNIVLVSANFDKCGKYVVDLKRELLPHQKDSNINFSGFKDGLQRVLYHNPRTSPHWRPPQVSVASLVDNGN